MNSINTLEVAKLNVKTTTRKVTLRLYCIAFIQILHNKSYAMSSRLLESVRDLSVRCKYFPELTRVPLTTRHQNVAFWKFYTDKVRIDQAAFHNYPGCRTSKSFFGYQRIQDTLFLLSKTFALPPHVFHHLLDFSILLG